MATRIQNRRSDLRHPLPGGIGVEIVFETPDERQHSFPLIDVSINGISFEIPRRLSGVEDGAMLPDAVIRLGKLKVQGNLVVIHMVRGYGPDYVVGAQLYPKTEEDRNELVDLIARLESLPKI